MRKNLILIWFVLYLLTILVPVWWPFDFYVPDHSKPYFESFEPAGMQYRPRFEKDVLKLALFIPVGIFLVVSSSRRKSKPTALASAVFVGGGLSILIQGGRYFLPGSTPNLTDVLMNTVGTLLGASAIYFSALSRRTLAGLIVVCIGCFIVAATWPGHFSLRAASLASLSRRVEWSPVSGDLSLGMLRERALNGLMMMPLGLLAATYSLRNRSISRTLIASTWLGLGSSLTVELLQCFLPNRTPSLSDISLNTLGTLAGAAVAIYLVRQEKAGFSSSAGMSVENSGKQG